MSQAQLDRWTPPRCEGVRMVKVGRYWDAIRAPVALGECVLGLLSGASGAVIADYNLMYWLVVPGSARSWQRIRQVQVLSADRAEVTYVGVPPVAHTTGPRLHWALPVGPGQYLTQADLLREALVRAVVAEMGPVEEASVR